jgi:hypothetical protein
MSPPTPRCPAWRRRWRAGGPYACACLDDDTPPANEPSVVVVRELPPLWPVLGLVVGAWGLLWAVWQGVRGGDATGRVVAVTKGIPLVACRGAPSVTMILQVGEWRVTPARRYSRGALVSGWGAHEPWQCSLEP